MVPVRLTSYRSHLRLVASGCMVAALLAGVVFASIVHPSSPALARGSNGLTGSILHIVRIAPGTLVLDEQGNQKLQPGDTYESWTGVADGLSKVVDTDGQGKVVMVSYEARRPDGSYAISTVNYGATKGSASLNTIAQAPNVNGHIPDGFWFGGESTLAGMQAEYAAYLQQAGANVTQVVLNGTPVRRFNARSADGLLGTIWLNSAGLPVQVEADHDPQQITRFPVIEELPATALLRSFFETAMLPKKANGLQAQRHK